MARMSIGEMKVSKIYPLLLNKVERKGRSKTELDAVISWLLGYDMSQVDQEMSYADFINNAPSFNPRSVLIKGKVCGIRVEEISDPFMKKVRYLDKLVDELAKGKSLDEILR